MPTYEYRCSHCSSVSSLRRAIGDMDEPVETLCCGARADRIFSPTRNVFVPLHFKQVLSAAHGNAPGGGQLSWSDFHDYSPRELARLKEFGGRPAEVVPAAEARSRSSGSAAKATGPSMAEVYHDVKRMPEGMRQEMLQQAAAAAVAPISGGEDG